MDGKEQYKCYAHLPEIQAACLRVMVLEDSKSAIGTLPGWVQFRIKEAAETLSECHDRIAALEAYVEAVQEANRIAFSDLASKYPAEEESTDGR